MNLFDVAVLVLLVGAVLIGVKSGALPQLGGLIGAFGGGAVAVLGLPWIEGPLGAVPPEIRAILVLAGILFLVGIGEAVGAALGRTLAIRLRGRVLDRFDRILGGFLGAAQALLVVWLIGGLLAAGPMRNLAVQAQTSLVVRGLTAILPAPTEIAAELGQLLHDTGIPDLFVGLDPLPAPDVDRPTDPAAQAIASAAIPSLVRVSAATCQFQSSGTGFAVARGYVVTNAHVVAGASLIRIQAPNGRPLDAVTVFDDPELDVALLWVRDLDVAPLRFAATDPDRGAVGATLGFPHGGGLLIEPAAVAGAYDAQGRDIYGTRRVSRRILELRAVVDQGDSGGPFILTDGSVGGVVFAEARTDENVGYALTPTSVAAAIRPSIGRTGPVDTGACIH
ncbi:MAG TPA: MarP family serine protease [Candidatus Limnocylindrales bacterium]|nr:MarP family serine protease [Candidatus Limnocylindrales bacterium]